MPPHARPRPSCRASTTARRSRAPSAPDAAPLRLREGMALARADALRLSPLLPAEVWRHRDVFFPDGMRMVIGACHRRYPPPRSFRIATERLADTRGARRRREPQGLHRGPALPRRVDRSRRARRGRALGVELRAAPSRRGTQRAVPDRRSARRRRRRADLGRQLVPAPARLPRRPRAVGISRRRGPARGVDRGRSLQRARRRARPRVAADAERAAAQQFTLPDDVFVFVPSLAKVRRAASAWVDGLYLPRYRATRRGDRIAPERSLPRPRGDRTPGARVHGIVDPPERLRLARARGEAGDRAAERDARRLSRAIPRATSVRAASRSRTIAGTSARRSRSRARCARAAASTTGSRSTSTRRPSSRST